MKILNTSRRTHGPIASTDRQRRVGWPNCAEKRDAIKATGAYPAFTLALTIEDANALLAHGWPNAKKIGAIPEGMIPVILISEEQCVVVLMRRD